MPTTVVKTIGSAGGRDYSTLQAWEDAAPANLVTADQIWRGEAYADSEFVVAGTCLTMAGSTTDATRYIELTAAAGQSFQDNANVRTNALTYNTANGVAIRSSSTYTTGVNITDLYARVSRVQFKGAKFVFVSYAGNGAGVFKDILGYTTDGGGGADLYHMSTTGTALLVNCLAINDSTGNYLSGAFEAAGLGTVTFIGCAAVRTANRAASGIAFHLGYASLVMQSCAAFGHTTAFSNPHSSTITGSKNNGTDAASGLPGTSNQHSITYSNTTPFVHANAAGGNDLRAIAGTTLIDNGFLDATNAPNDISGTARDSTPTIGVWEIVAAAGRTTKNTRAFPLGIEIGMNWQGAL